jgi:hypothetical protein
VDIVILVGSGVLTGLGVMAVAMVVAGARADRAQQRLSRAAAPRAVAEPTPIRRFRRAARRRSSTPH